MKSTYSILLITLFVNSSCGESSTTEEILASENTTEETIETQIKKGDVLINEFSVNSTDLNEYEKKSDWIELYNSTSKDIKFSPGAWSITDNMDKTDKYIIPSVTIPANGYLILWCDGESTFDEEIHTSFKLSGKGETIGLFQNGDLMDEITYDSLANEFPSMGRVTDGAEEWKMFEASTISASNSPTL
ncbi:MAG: lamin tail domain-containing protein [Crocinitomicaceae bacterium]|nr:lamin tail domain-containing protein [Crocinitomicaceae bacterium]